MAKAKKNIGFGPDSLTFTKVPKVILRAALKVGDAYPNHKVEAFREGANWHIFGGKSADLRYVVREADGKLLGVEKYDPASGIPGDWGFVEVVDTDTWKVEEDDADTD